MSLFSNNFHGGIIIRQIKRRKEKKKRKIFEKHGKSLHQSRDVKSHVYSRENDRFVPLVVENIFQNGGENNISCLLQALVTIY